MKTKILCLLIVPVVAFFFSCDGQLPDDILVSISFDGTVFDAENETLDFGIREVGGTESQVTALIGNLGESTITITALSLDNEDNYTMTPIDIPFELTPGGEAEFSLSFSPVSNGTKAAIMDITTSGEIETTISVNLTGEGNVAPAAIFGIEVSGAAQYTDVNGFYTKDGTFNSAPTYTKSGTPDYHIYFFVSDGFWWGISDSFNEDYPSFSEGRSGPHCYIGNIGDTYPSNFPPEFVDNMDYSANWVENYIGTPEITVKTGITFDGGNLIANYQYSDEDGDAESGSIYQWLQSTTTVDGTYSELSGETENTYTFQYPGDLDTFFKVQVTPVDANGFEGDMVTSDPYIVESSIIPE